MSLSRLLSALVPVCLFTLVAVVSADDAAAIEKEVQENTPQKSVNSTKRTASASNEPSPVDTTPRFAVKALQIRGNNIISTPELFEELPEAYTVSMTEDGKTVDTVYDFRVLHDLIFDPGTERSVSLKTIQGFTKYVLSVYQEKGYAGIYVYVPAEAVKDKTRLADAVLSVRVLEGKIARVSIERYDFDRNPREKGYLKESVLESWSPVKAGDVIRKKKLDNFIRLLNLNPDRHISPVMSRSTEPNSLNLTYDLHETSPWHWSIQVDNAGTRDRQWSPRAGFIHTNLTGVDDRISAMYQAPWEKGIEDRYALFGSYDRPIFTPRLRLNVYSGYSQFDIPQAGIKFLGNGSFYGSMLTYNVLQIDDWFVGLTGSLSQERSKVTPSLGIASDVDMELWGIGAGAHRTDDMSSTSLVFNRSENMGGSNRREFEDARIGADPDFTIYSFTATHSQFFDSDKVNRAIGSFRSVTSNERLVPAKMTAFGGLYSVRGYEEDEIVADGGIIASGQYEFDLVKIDSAQQGETDKSMLRRFAPVVFVDYGRAKVKDTLAGEKRVQELCSIGTGIVFDVGDDFSAQIYYGWALRETDETDRGSGRLHASFIKRF